MTQSIEQTLEANILEGKAYLSLRVFDYLKTPYWTYFYNNEFGGMAEAYEEQKTAAAQVNGETLTDQLRAPGKDISAAAGRMERDSPLFYGTGENPLLF